MPRAPKKTKGAPWCYAKPYHLKDEEKRNIADNIMGWDWDDSRKCKQAKGWLRLVENCLGAYPSLIEATDQEPTSAQYSAELEDLRKLAWKLKEDCCAISYWMEELLEKNGAQPDALIRQLSVFIGGTSCAQSDLNGKESRGQPKKKALRMLINTLNGLFEKKYITPDLDGESELRKRNERTARDEARETFISACLNAAKIRYPKDFLKLLYNEETPEEERLFITKMG